MQHVPSFQLFYCSTVYTVVSLFSNFIAVVEFPSLPAFSVLPFHGVRQLYQLIGVKVKQKKDAYSPYLCIVAMLQIDQPSHAQSLFMNRMPAWLAEYVLHG